MDILDAGDTDAFRLREFVCIIDIVPVISGYVPEQKTVEVRICLATTGRTGAAFQPEFPDLSRFQPGKPV